MMHQEASLMMHQEAGLLRSHRSGFTLVEVLVALMVFAIVGFTVTSRVGEIVNQTFGLERRTVAHWVAENHLNRMRIVRRSTSEPIPTGRERELVLMSGREWRLDINIEDTAHPWLRRVEIDVYEIVDDVELGPIENMSSFIGRY